MMLRTTLCLLGLAAGVFGYTVQHGFKANADAPASFALRNTRGQTIAAAQFRGRWTLVFFGYTHCPDFCPTALTAAGGALDALGAAAAGVKVAFISLDPARDTPDVLAAYLQSFDPRIAGLTGSEAEVAAAARAFKVFFQKRPGRDNDDYGIDHTAAFWLLDPDGRTAEVYGYDISPQDLAEALRRRMSMAPV